MTCIYIAHTNQSVPLLRLRTSKEIEWEKSDENKTITNIVKARAAKNFPRAGKGTERTTPTEEKEMERNDWKSFGA